MMLWLPASCRASIVCARAAVETGRPRLPWLMSWFWQKTQRRLHRLKNTAPDPLSPDMGGSSQKCRSHKATSGRIPAWQNPFSPVALSTWQ